MFALILLAAAILSAVGAYGVIRNAREEKAYIDRVVARQALVQRNNYNRLCERYEFIVPVHEA